MSDHNAPLSNINGSLVNIDNSAPGNLIFESTVNPVSVNPRAYSGIQNNITAANASQIGGKRKKSNKKRNKISRIYKMKTRKHYKKRRSLKNKIMKVMRKKYKSKSKRVQKGGIYSQYHNNYPFTPSYSTGGYLNVNDSALANPVPYHIKNSCIDQYNHNAPNLFGKIGPGNGLQSPGSY
jgi:hypothetical protein